MSETRYYTGKLVKLERRFDQTIEDQAKQLLGGEELESYYDSYLEQLTDKNYKEYFIKDGTLYSIKDLSEEDSESDMFKARKINGNDYEFEVRYYDGGCSLDEALETALERIK